MNDTPELVTDHCQDLGPEGETIPTELDRADVADALEHADRHLAHVRRLRNELADLQARYEAEIDRLHDRLAERAQIINGQIDWHLRPVRQLHERLVDEGTHGKTIELPNGTMKLSVPKTARIVVDDQEGLVSWALTNAPDLLPPPRKVNVSDVKEWAQVRDGKVIDPATGEIVPHVRAEVPDPRWNVDTEPGSPL